MAEAMPPLSHVEKIELGIVQLLKDGGLNARYLLDRFPARPDEFDLDNIDRAVLVQYTSSRYGAPEGHGSAQTRRPVFALHIYLRAGVMGFRPLLEVEAIRLAVQGQHVEGAELIIQRDALVDQNGDLWRYVIELTCGVPAVPARAARPSPFIEQFQPQGAT